MVRKRPGTGFYILLIIVLLITIIVYMKYSRQELLKHNQVIANLMRDKRSPELRCCEGTLGFSTNHAQMPVTCPDMKCCNKSETVAVIPIEDAMGFRFRCVSKTKIRPVCYQPGTEVRSSNQDPDHIPRACCEGAKFEVELNKWYAAMSIKCVLR